MNITFNNAPLVEIIAELRWTPASQHMLTPQNNGGAPSIFDSNAFEEFFMRFAGECYQHDFKRTERLVPSGFPSIVGQPVFRYKKGSEEVSSELYQVGPGLFTANATPPYKSWVEFSPVVKNGVNALLLARNPTEKEIAFSKVSLRYIDAFGPNLTKGMPLEDFVSEVLGFKVGLPLPVSSLVAQGQKAKVYVQLNFATANGMSVNVTVGEGQANNSPVVVLDTTVSSINPVEPNTGAVMAALAAAREIIHNMFVKLTENIRSEMNPNEGA